ncbi:hypothetical protein KY341_06215 [Candidatus Woesearchaeota archaeon]|nr:hypothetical protein [Candidatus Woesearchaeota archaeon]
MIRKQKKSKSTKYWLTQRDALLASFRNIPNKAFFKAMLYDFLTLIAILIVLNIGALFINLVSVPAFPKLLNVYQLGQNGNEEVFQQAIVEFAPVLNRVLWLSLIISIITCLLLVFFISLFYGKAWSIRLKKKFSTLAFRKYFLLNFVWLIAWIIILIITINVFVIPVATFFILIEFLFFLYSDPALRTVFDEKKTLRQNFSKFFKCIKRVHWFIFFLITAILLMLILLLITGLFIEIPVLFAIITLIFALFFMGWVRNYIIYIINITKHIKN